MPKIGPKEPDKTAGIEMHGRVLGQSAEAVRANVPLAAPRMDAPLSPPCSAANLDRNAKRLQAEGSKFTLFQTLVINVVDCMDAIGALYKDSALERIVNKCKSKVQLPATKDFFKRLYASIRRFLTLSKKEQTPEEAIRAYVASDLLAHIFIKKYYADFTSPPDVR